MFGDVVKTVENLIVQETGMELRTDVIRNGKVQVHLMIRSLSLGYVEVYACFDGTILVGRHKTGVFISQCKNDLPSVLNPLFEELQKSLLISED